MPHDSLSLQAAFKYLFIEEVHALKELAQSLSANPVVVNIGAGSGTSGLAFMESRKLFLYTIDTQLEDSPLGCLQAEERVLWEAGHLYKSFDLNSGYQQYHADSKEVAKQWDLLTTHVPWHNKVDMVFIDGDHSYNGCKGDILAWLPNIKPGGIMAVHDFGKKEVYKDGPIDNAPHPLPWPGVDRAVRHYLCPYYEMILKVRTLVAFRIK